MSSIDAYELWRFISDEKDADYMFGGAQFVINDAEIERLKNGEILNFSVNMEYGCTLKYERCNNDSDNINDIFML